MTITEEKIVRISIDNLSHEETMVLWVIIILKQTKGYNNNNNSAGKGYLTRGSYGEYLGPRGMKMGSGEGSAIRNFIVVPLTLYSQGEKV